MSMYLRLYIPSTIDAPDDWSIDQRTRLQQVIARAIERAVATVDRSTAHVEIVRAVKEETSPAGASLANTLVELAQRQGDPKERLDEARLYSDGKGYGLPSYRDAGAQVEVPLQGAIAQEASTTRVSLAGAHAQVEVPVSGLAAPVETAAGDLARGSYCAAGVRKTSRHLGDWWKVYRSGWQPVCYRWQSGTCHRVGKIPLWQRRLYYHSAQRGSRRPELLRGSSPRAAEHSRFGRTRHRA